MGGHIAPRATGRRLEKVGFQTFLERRPANDYQNYETGHSVATRSQFVGEVKRVADGWAEVETNNRFAVGDWIEIITPQGNRTVHLQVMKNAEGHAIDVAAGNPLRVWIPVDGPAEHALIARLATAPTESAAAVS